MRRLYMITLPGLAVTADWRVVHDRLLDEFPNVHDVLPTTAPETVLIVYRGRADIDEWLETMSEVVLRRRERGPDEPVQLRPQPNAYGRPTVHAPEDTTRNKGVTS